MLPPRSRAGPPLIISCHGASAKAHNADRRAHRVVTGLTALVAAVFGTVGELIALGVIAIVVIVVGAYGLSRP